LTALSPSTLSGYGDTSAIWKFGTGRGVIGRAYDGTAKQDGFNLNVVKLSLSKPVDEGQWSAGYTVDLLAGPDAVAFGTQASGTGDLAIKQAYVALRAPIGNGLDFKVGVWDTIIGYEVFDSGSNPNYSRSFGYILEPTTYTGVLGSYKFCDAFSLSVGVANNAAGPRFGPGFPVNVSTAPANRSAVESRKTYLASATLTAPESWGSLKGAALYGGVIKHASTGGFTAPGLNGSDIVNYYAGVSIPTPLTGLAFGLAYDYTGYSQISKPGTAGYSPSAYANAAAVYVTYQATEKLKLNTRADYTSSTDGFWYTTGKPVTDNDRRNELFGLTFTSDYSLWDNVVTRLEARWDSALTGGPGAKPYGLAANGDKNAISLALNVIYKF